MGNRMFQHAYLYSQMRKGLIKDVYVQDPSYFEGYEDEIRQLYSEGIGYEDKVGIHVRRGDYVGNPFYVDLMETDYYQRAMDEFEGEEFIVFSDDIEWCKKQDIFKGCEFSEGSELEDFNKLASCDGVITANSSFSWWAGFLSCGKVVAPIEWYSDKIERTKCPKEWIRL